MGDKLLVNLRHAKVTDLPQLLAIESACFTTDLISSRQMRYLITRAKGAFWVATYQQQVVGYAIVFLPAHPKPARLYSIAIHPDFQGVGIAKQLLTTLLETAQAKAYKKCHLEVSYQNASAIALYKQLGFQPLVKLIQYYQDGSDALRMCLNWQCIKSVVNDL